MCHGQARIQGIPESTKITDVSLYVYVATLYAFKLYYPLLEATSQLDVTATFRSVWLHPLSAVISVNPITLSLDNTIKKLNGFCFYSHVCVHWSVNVIRQSEAQIRAGCEPMTQKSGANCTSNLEPPGRLCVILQYYYLKDKALTQSWSTPVMLLL